MLDFAHIYLLYISVPIIYMQWHQQFLEDTKKIHDVKTVRVHLLLSSTNYHTLTAKAPDTLSNTATEKYTIAFIRELFES